MANFYGTARSNYFRVKDETKFEEWVNSLPDVEFWKQGDKFAISSSNQDSGTWPNYRRSEESDDYIELDIALELSEFLAEGEVAVLMEAGAEKLRYISAWAVAVNWKGETEYLNLDSIYSIAEERWGIKPTQAVY